MLTITIRVTRPSTDIKFYNSSEEYKKYFQENFIDTKRIVNVNKSISVDGLTNTSTITWADEDSFRKFTSDAYCYDNYIVPVKKYNTENNIVSETSYNETEFIKSFDVWKKFNPEEYFSGIEIPNDWATLEDFVDWYVAQRMPLMIPWNAEIICSDDAVAVCIFRKGHYQIEFYLEYPNMSIRKHAHPRMEVITMDLGGGGHYPAGAHGVSRIWGQALPKLLPGEYHGGDRTTQVSNGFITLAFQRWENPDEMTSAAVQWCGELQGNIQADLIKRKKVAAIVSECFADVTNDTGVKND